MAVKSWKTLVEKFHPIAPAQDAYAVVKSDVTALSPSARSLYIGVSGDVVVKTMEGNTVTFKACPVGVLPVSCTFVMAATTATDIVGLL